MDWFASELRNQLSEFAQDVLATEPEADKDKNSDLSENPSSLASINQPIPQGLTTSLDFNAPQPSPNFSQEKSKAPPSNNSSQQNNSFVPFDQPNLVPQQRPPSNLRNNVRPINSNPNANKVNYSQRGAPQQPLVRPPAPQQTLSNQKDQSKLYSRINELEIKNLQLEEQLKRVTVPFSVSNNQTSLLDKIKHLEAQLRKTTQEKLDSQKLQDKIAELSQESARLLEESNSSKQEILTLNANFEAKLAAIAKEHKLEIDSKKEANSESTHSFNVLKKDFEELKISHDELLNSQGSLESKLIAESSRAEGFENKIKKLREEKESSATEQIASLQNDKTNLLDNLNKLKDDIKLKNDQYELELKELTSSLDDANTNVKNLEEKILEHNQLENKLEQEKDKSNSEVMQSKKAFEEKLNQLEKENEVLRSSIQEEKILISQHLSEFNTEKEKLVVEKDDLAEKLKSISIRFKESESLVHKTETNKTSIENECSVLKVKVDEITRVNQELQDSTISLTTDLSVSQQSIIELNSKITILSKELQDANSNLNSCEEKIKDFASAKLDLETQVTKLESDNNESAAKLSKLESINKKALKEAQIFKEKLEKLNSSKNEEANLLSDKLEQVESSLKTNLTELRQEINKRENLESTIVELKEQNSNFLSDKTKFENQLKAHMESKGSDEASIKLFEEQLEESRNLLEETRNKLAQTITDSTSSLRTLEKENVTLKSKISDLELKNDEYSKLIDLEKTKFSEKMIENDTMINQLKNDINESNATINSLEEQMKKSQKEHQHEKSRISKTLEVSKKSFSDSLSSLQNKNSSLTKQIEDLQKEKSEADTLILELKRTTDSSQSDIKRVTEELDSLKVTTQLNEEEKKKDVELLDAQIISLKASLENYKQDIIALNQSKADLDMQMQDLISQNTSLNFQLNQVNNLLDDSKKNQLSTENRCSGLEEELSLKSKNLLNIEKDLNDCSEKLQEALDSNKNEAVLHSKYVNDTNIQISELSTTIEKFKVSIDKKDLEIADLLSKFADKTNDTEAALKKIEELNIELNSLKFLSSSQAAELEELKKQLNLSSSSHKDSAMKIKELLKENETLLGSKALLDTSIVDLENKLKGSNIELENKLNELEQTKKSLKDLEALNGSNATEKDNLITSLQSELNNMQELLGTKEEALNKLSSQLDFELTQVNNQHQVQLAELQQEIDDYAASIDKLKNIIQNLTIEKRSLSDDHDKLLDKVNTMKITVKNKLKEQEDENANLKTHLSVLESTHAELNKLYENIQVQLEELSEERNQLKSQIKTQTVNLEKLNSEILSLQQQSNQEKLGQETLLNEHIYRQKELEEQVMTLELKLSKESEVRNQQEKALVTSQGDLTKTLEEFNQLRQDYDAAQDSLLKLQHVLEELQGAQSAEVDFAVEKLQRLVDSRAQNITELEYRAATAEAKLADYSQKVKQVDTLAAEAKSKGNEVLNLKKELTRVNDQLIDVSKRLRRMGGGEDIVSREFLAGLFTRFANFPRGDPGKFEMLEIISAALRLSPEEQVEVGLVRETSQAHIYPSFRLQSSSNISVSKPISASNITSLDQLPTSSNQSSPTFVSKYQMQPERNSDIGSI